MTGDWAARLMQLPWLLWSLPARALEGAERIPALWLGLLPVGLVAVVASATFDPRVYPGGDNALYWALGRSLFESFEYRDLGAPGSPYETSIPWGFPLLIAAGMALLPDGYPYLKIVCWLSMVGAFACLWGLLQFVLKGYRGVAVLALLALAVNHRLVTFASMLLTEAPFLLCSMGALLAFEVHRRRWADRWWGVVPAAAMASYGYLIRPAGVALVAALLGYLVLSRKWKTLGVAMVVVGILAGSWHVRSALVPSESENLYLSYLVKKNKYQTDDATVDAGGIVDRVTHNARAYTVGPLHRLSLGFKWKNRSGISPIVLPMLVLIGAGYALTLGRAGPIHLYVPLYLGVILLWLPESVKDRYLAMIFSLLLPLALFGLYRSLALRWPHAAAWVTVGLFALMFYFQGGRAAVKAERYAAVREAFDEGQHEVGRRRSYRSYVQMCEWIRDNAPEDAILGARKPRLAYLYSGRQAVRTTFSEDPDEVYGWFVDNGIDYVLLDRLDSQVEDTRIRMIGAQLKYHDHFADQFATFLGDRVAMFSPDTEVIEDYRAQRADFQRRLREKRLGRTPPSQVTTGADGLHPMEGGGEPSGGDTDEDPDLDQEGG